MLSVKNKEENKEAVDELCLKSYYTCSFSFWKFCEMVAAGVQTLTGLVDRSLTLKGDIHHCEYDDLNQFKIGAL